MRGVNKGKQILIFRKIRQSADIFTKIRIRSTVREVRWAPQNIQ